MTHHWPLVLAAGLVGTAITLGLWQRERAYEIVRNPVAKVTPVPLSSSSAPENPPAADKPDGSPTTPTQSKVTVTTPTAYAVAKSALPADQFPKIWTELKQAIQNKTGVAAIDKGNGAAGFSLDGATVDLQPLPGWGITIYNINPKQPEVESEHFKTCTNAVCEVLGLDPLKKPLGSGGSGPTFVKVMSKLGNVSIIRDPSGANTWMIRPAP